MSKSICDNCIKDCCWRTPSGGLDPPVITCTEIILKSQTNADNIRNMTDEELAKIFALKRPCPPFAKWPASCENGCGNCWLNWLQQEVE